jgi:adenosylhomocysteine nucleosidase
MQAEMSRLAIIVAMEREAAALVAGWTRSCVRVQGMEVSLCERDRVTVAWSGIGTRCARAAADAAYSRAGGELEVMVSAGLAGALAPELRTGDIVRPASIVDESDDQRIEVPGGEGTLITCATIADAETKRRLAARPGACAVDMEAYAVADVARVYGVPFQAIKVISDEADFPMPALGRFVDGAGRFQTGRFVLYSAFHPTLWPVVRRLGKDSARAVSCMAEELRRLMKTFE